MSPRFSLALEIVLEGKCCHGRRGDTLPSTPTSECRITKPWLDQMAQAFYSPKLGQPCSSMSGSNEHCVLTEGLFRSDLGVLKPFVQARVSTTDYQTQISPFYIRNLGLGSSAQGNTNTRIHSHQSYHSQPGFRICIVGGFNLKALPSPFLSPLPPTCYIPNHIHSHFQ